MEYSDQERSHFLRVFIQEGSSYIAFQRRIRRETGERHPKMPSETTLRRWDQKFSDGNLGQGRKQVHRVKFVLDASILTQNF